MWQFGIKSETTGEMSLVVEETWLWRCADKHGVSDFAKFAACAAYNWRSRKSRINFSEKQSKSVWLEGALFYLKLILLMIACLV